MYACCCCCCRNVEVLQEQLHAAQQQTQQAHAAQKEAQQQLEELQFQQQQHRDWHALLQACAQAAEVSRCVHSNAAYAAQQAWRVDQNALLCFWHVQQVLFPVTLSVQHAEPSTS